MAQSRTRLKDDEAAHIDVRPLIIGITATLTAVLYVILTNMEAPWYYSTILVVAGAGFIIFIFVTMLLGCFIN